MKNDPRSTLIVHHSKEVTVSVILDVVRERIANSYCAREFRNSLLFITSSNSTLLGTCTFLFLSSNNIYRIRFIELLFNYVKIFPFIMFYFGQALWRKETVIFEGFVLQISTTELTCKF